ncbi:hypothetical protein [Bifidobacterium tissieri]|uniref:hypothetical protein n=1 Tax=Bifidobacterium tissieri TaxID=1630162 RepID=UPI0012393DE2|nr:hypothetical protein [Bifidobacterium tissieri]KAA8832608.1 hypothetical protein EM849_03640 [Bifidobacterium tissieri]
MACVTSRNLLQYGPVAVNGLTVTVTDLGELHVSGTAGKPWSGVRWDQNLTDLGLKAGDTVIYSPGALPDGYDVYLSAWNNTTGKSEAMPKSTAYAIPDGVTMFQLRVQMNGTSMPIDAVLRPQLELGDTVSDWERPDVTDASGGGQLG